MKNPTHSKEDKKRKKKKMFVLGIPVVQVVARTVITTVAGTVAKDAYYGVTRRKRSPKAGDMPKHIADDPEMREIYKRLKKNN